jgi:Flp pilus assembly protein TadD
MSAIVVLGMHRSGTSCLAGMLAAAGAASAGEAVRNWDNARGHHEMLDVVRLNEAVLAHSGGHWLAAPSEVRWTAEHAAARDRPLLKDPRALLALPFWRASDVPYRAVGIVRHPLAVARSLASWRGTPLDEGIALWTAHNAALEEDRARHAYALVDFEQPKAAVVAAAHAAFPELDATALASAFEEQLVHHDDGDAPALAGLDTAIALYRRLAAGARSAAVEPARRPAFPRAELAAFGERLEAGALEAARERAAAALEAAADPAAVIVPVVTSLLRHGTPERRAAALALIAQIEARLDDGLAELLRAKVLLAAGDPTAAARHLEAACAVANPYHQARHMLPHALREAGRRDEARAALRDAAATALYPHGPLATLAEWTWLDGDRPGAIAEMRRAIAAAPPHRRGRLRSRLAEWLLASGDPAGARAELELAVVEDPAYPRSRELLARLA